MKRELLEKYLNKKISTQKIAETEKVSRTTVRYWLNKYNLKVDWRPNALEKWNWKEIQKDHNNGLNWREIAKKHKISMATLDKAAKLKLFVSRTAIEAINLAHNMGKVDYSVYKTENFLKKVSNNGGYRKNSGRGKGEWKENSLKEKYYLQSSFETRLADILNSLNINWKRPNALFYTLNNQSKKYYADFYLPKYNLFLDTKNDYLAILDQNKIEAVKNQNRISLLVITENLINVDDIENILSLGSLNLL